MIFVIAEQKDNKLKPITSELLVFAQRVGRDFAQPITVVVLGSNTAAAADELQCVVQVGLRAGDALGVGGRESGAAQDREAPALDPLFLALAAVTAGRPRLHTAAIACSALFLGVAVVQWALWQWVA